MTARCFAYAVCFTSAWIAGVAVVPALAEPGVDFNPLAAIEEFNSAECCMFVDRLDAVELPKQGKLELDLTASGRLLELSTGPSFACLVRLPEPRKKIEFELRSSIIEYGDGKYAFFPYVAGLDENFNLVGSTGATRPSYVGTDWLRPAAYLEMFFTVGNEDDDSRIRYLLVYTRPRHFTKTPPEGLRGQGRSIEIGEVSARLNERFATSRSDVIYGLPAGPVMLQRQGLF